MRPVLIVADHPLVAEATGRRLAHYGEDLSIVVCSSAAQTLAALDSEHTDWFRIFLDLDVPGAYGLSLAREIRDRRLAAKCCVVSAFDRRDYIEELQAWGFLGYIVKAVSVSEFTSSINSVVEGRSQFPQPSRTERAALSPLRLTRRQTEILELVRARLSSKQIAGALNVTGGTVRGAVMTDKATQDEREAFERGEYRRLERGRGRAGSPERLADAVPRMARMASARHLREHRAGPSGAVRTYRYRNEGDGMPCYAPLMNRPMAPVFTAEQMHAHRAGASPTGDTRPEAEG